MDSLSLMSIFRRLSDKDEPAFIHGRCVARLACAIAKAMNYSNEENKIIYHAAVIHDIGKILLPAEIINKPDSLDYDELALVKKHPKLGYSLLQVLEYEPIATRVALQHHERLDGSGYPVGLRGKHIIPAARIIAVADVIEAMLSPQVYRPALTLYEALQEIKQNGGLLYDPEVVAVTLAIIGKNGFNFNP